MNIKTVCVLGGTGFLGNRVVSKLDAAGYQVKVLARHRERAKQLILLPNVQVKTCDFNDSKALENHLVGMDAVINLVGILHETRRNTFENVHHQLPRRIAQLCKQLGIKRLLHVSALGADKQAPSRYLQSKAKGEAALDDYGKQLAITIFKPSVIFGREDQFLNLFASIVKWLPIVFLAKPEAKFQPVWVDNVAESMLNSLNNGATYGKRYALGGPKVYTLKQLVEIVIQHVGKSRWVIGLSDRLSYVQAFFMEWLPVKLITRDNIRSMEVDNVTAKKIAPELGVTPTPLEAVVGDYLLDKTPRSIYNTFRRAAGRAINATR